MAAETIGYGAPSEPGWPAGHAPEPHQWPTTPFELAPSLVLLGRRGSEAHGLYQGPSADGLDDRDLMGVVVPPLRYHLGLRGWDGVEAIKDEWDTVLYSLRKFVRLLLKQNPNVLSLLWLADEDYLLVTATGRQIIAHRDLFRGRDRAYKAFAGYANSQLQRMTRGERRGYMGAKRAAHCIRLLHMGEEYLRTGVINVRRTWDHDLLLGIKGGEVGLDFIQKYAAERFAGIKEAVDDSPLPAECDEAAVEALLMHLTSVQLGVA